MAEKPIARVAAHSTSPVAIAPDCEIRARSPALGMLAAKLALRTQQVVGYESGVTDTVDPLAGSYYVEWLTDEVERGVRFALSVPGVQAFCTPGDTGVLATALEAAENFTPLDEAARARAPAEVEAEPHIFPMPTG